MRPGASVEEVGAAIALQNVISAAPFKMIVAVGAGKAVGPVVPGEGVRPRAAEELFHRSQAIVSFTRREARHEIGGHRRRSEPSNLIDPLSPKYVSPSVGRYPSIRESAPEPPWTTSSPFSPSSQSSP